jgi:hypothetical protein
METIVVYLKERTRLGKLLGMSAATSSFNSDRTTRKPKVKA